MEGQPGSCAIRTQLWSADGRVLRTGALERRQQLRGEPEGGSGDSEGTQRSALEASRRPRGRVDKTTGRHPGLASAAECLTTTSSRRHCSTSCLHPAPRCPGCDPGVMRLREEVRQLTTWCTAECRARIVRAMRADGELREYWKQKEECCGPQR
eukprot:6272892-Amphidinium_carterae.1